MTDDPISRPRARVSVCVPTYNNAAFVAETIESILAQDYQSFEVVIADHGSTDHTLDIVRQFANDPRVRLILGPAGGGAQANWNRATGHAVGDYIKLACADDPLYPGCLTKQVAALENNPGVVLVASKRDIIDATGAVVYRGRGLAGLDGRVPSELAVRRAVLAGTNIFGEPSSVLMRADALRASGPWSDALPYLIDEDMYVRVLLNGDFYALPESLATFRVSKESWSLALAREQAVQTRAFHEIVRAAYPDAVHRRDLRIGGMRAEVNAWARRVIYLWLRGRLTTADAKSEQG
jgi:glycosyltransferase involved in cell wall biosynthesis